MSFTRRAEESADRMEKLAVDMHEIAKKTERETVSMRIITLVTLFFLPGTFMSVSHLLSQILLCTINQLPLILTHHAIDDNEH